MCESMLCSLICKNIKVKDEDSYAEISRNRLKLSVSRDKDWCPMVPNTDIEKERSVTKCKEVYCILFVV